jgi:predicted lipoprotein with Yx(FWY)xxD motif
MFNPDPGVRAMTSMSVSLLRRAGLAAAVTTTLMLGASAVMAQSAPAMTAGGVLTNAAGMTLYTFDRDAADRSACNGSCAQNWPPLMAAADAKAPGDYSVVTRDDGSRQWAYKGKPLYTWVKDTKPGDTTGDGVNSVWHVARP